MSHEELAFDVVVPTIGRPSLTTLLRILDREVGPAARVILVDDRACADVLLPIPPLSPALGSRVVTIASGGRGPAAARNAGWRASTAPWVVFLDDDVEPSAGWLTAVSEDLRDTGPGVAGVQARIVVPMPPDRRPTDWERNVAALETAPWITADMAYRRDVLEDAGGFDERFRRAYREDTDLALRVQALGWALAYGRRTVLHPARPVDAWASLRLQRGNADDVLMTALHPGYRDGPTRLGRRPWHAATVALFAGALAAFALGASPAGGVLVIGWAALTGALALRRIAPGPRTPREVGTMVATTALIPFAACVWWILGAVHLPRLLADVERAPRPRSRSAASRGKTFEAAS